jgi:hypothetical protein
MPARRRRKRGSTIWTGKMGVRERWPPRQESCPPEGTGGGLRLPCRDGGAAAVPLLSRADQLGERHPTRAREVARGKPEPGCTDRPEILPLARAEEEVGEYPLASLCVVDPTEVHLHPGRRERPGEALQRVHVAQEEDGALGAILQIDDPVASGIQGEKLGLTSSGTPAR